ncbi:hypothetical protein AMECASPLE_039780 [Ameca splendens]|uniref:Uncharacterized protein n=1 Tax=Ameca splendens TaxID=208324 RepID=A0ABV0XLN2_9TELE
MWRSSGSTLSPSRMAKLLTLSLRELKISSESSSSDTAAKNVISCNSETPYIPHSSSSGTKCIQVLIRCHKTTTFNLILHYTGDLSALKIYSLWYVELLQLLQQQGSLTYFLFTSAKIFEHQQALIDCL